MITELAAGKVGRPYPQCLHVALKFHIPDMTTGAMDDSSELADEISGEDELEEHPISQHLFPFPRARGMPRT